MWKGLSKRCEVGLTKELKGGGGRASKGLSVSMWPASRSGMSAMSACACDLSSRDDREF